MKRFSVLITFLFFSSHLSAWTINADFEGGTVGQKAKANNAFTGAFRDTKFSNAQVHSGSRSAIASIAAGDQGFGRWGGSWDYPDLFEGDEMWFRLWVYFPSGFSFSCGGCSQGMKFMRIHTASPSGSNEGYHSTLIENSMNIDSEVNGKSFYSNNGPAPFPAVNNVGSAVTTGTWHAFEQYIKFSSKPGQGVYRFWQDGKLIFEDKRTATLRSSNSKSDFLYLWTYWNNGAPKSQSAYIDDVIVTNEKPSGIDAQGNPFVGLGKVSNNNKPNNTISPPKPPVVR